MLSIKVPQNFTPVFSTPTSFQEYSWDDIDVDIDVDSILSLPSLSLPCLPLASFYTRNLTRNTISASFQEFSWDDLKIESSVFSSCLVNVINFYKEICVLGEGAFGKVLLVEDISGKRFARKECTDKKNDYNTQHEAEMMRLLQGCENIVQLIETIPNREGVDLIMELCDGTLLDLIHESRYDGLGEIITKDLAQDMIRAIQFMRERDISHCDLKPENILYKRDQSRHGGYRFLVGDFGNSDQGDVFPYFFRIQTNHYRCAENLISSLKKEETDISSCDYGSLGCILCEAITGEYLVEGEEGEENDQLLQILTFIGMTKLQKIKNLVFEKEDSIYHDVYEQNRMIKVSRNEKYDHFQYVFDKICTFENYHIWLDFIRELLLPFPNLRLKGKNAEELSMFL